MTLDALVISDIHLGSDNSQVKTLAKFLNKILNKEIQTEKLIINGDLFDSFDFRRLKKTHWHILSLLRHLSDKLELILVRGNHPGGDDGDIVCHLIGAELVDHYILYSGPCRIGVIHGDIFDDFITKHPVMTYIADCIYAFLQKIDKTHKIAKFAKVKSKIFVGCANNIKLRAVKWAKSNGLHAVLVGHSHKAEYDEIDYIRYGNSACWTEIPCHFITVNDGIIKIEQFN